MAPPGCLLPHRPHRADFPQRVPQADSPVTSSHVESEAAATDDVEGARHISPTSSGFRACDDSDTFSKFLRRPDRTSEGSESLSVGRNTGSAGEPLSFLGQSSTRSNGMASDLDCATQLRSVVRLIGAEHGKQSMQQLSHNRYDGLQPSFAAS